MPIDTPFAAESLASGLALPSGLATPWAAGPLTAGRHGPTPFPAVTSLGPVIVCTDDPGEAPGLCVGAPAALLTPLEEMPAGAWRGAAVSGCGAATPDFSVTIHGCGLFEPPSSGNSNTQSASINSYPKSTS